MRGIATRHKLNVYSSLCAVSSCVFTTTADDVFGLKHYVVRFFHTPTHRYASVRAANRPLVEKVGKTAATATSASEP